VRFRNFRVSNVCATVDFGHRITLETLADDLRHHGGYRASHDPDLHPWLLVKTTTAGTFMVFSSGKANVTGAPSLAAVEAEVARMQLVVWQHRNEL
jgi:TATA-box binding protein (TBP) (component of TFIID and TFIIIB)